MSAANATEYEIVGYLDRLSNWGRWGGDDRLGTLNLITDAKRREAAAGVREGLAIGCGRPIVFEAGASDVLVPPILQPLPTAPSDGADPRIETAAEVVGCAPHGVTVTHLDALSHFRVDGRSYNGRRPRGEPDGEGSGAREEPAARGERGEAVDDPLRDGIVTRGVLVDVAALRDRPWLDPGDRIQAEDVEQWERAHDVEVTEGDALLVRTGWARRRRELGPYPERKHRPGLDPSMLPWLRDRGVALVASDAAHDAIPSGLTRIPMPIHAVGLVAMGLWLVDNGDFDRLADACAARSRWSFLFMAAPPRFSGATGTPVNPIAVL